MSEEKLARIQGPCGLDIGADTQAETALSILSEILAVRAQRPRRAVARRRSSGSTRRWRSRLCMDRPGFSRPMFTGAMPSGSRPTAGTAAVATARPRVALRAASRRAATSTARGSPVCRRSHRSAAFARGACHDDVTTTTSRAPTRSTSLRAFARFSTVVRASGSTTTSRAAPRHAARIRLASACVPDTRAQPERTTTSSAVAISAARSSRAAQTGCSSPRPPSE